MPIIDESTSATMFKIVYYGPGLCGKTTNIDIVYRAASGRSAGTSSYTKEQRLQTLLGEPQLLTPSSSNESLQLRLFNTPCSRTHDPGRLQAVTGADAVIFVADSQQARMEANGYSLDELRSHFVTLGIVPSTLPYAVQYNKRDLPTCVPVDEMQSALNLGGAPFFEAVAYQGVNVLPTLHSAWTQLIARHGLHVPDPDAMLEWPLPEVRRHQPIVWPKRTWLDRLLGR
jgi:signal recognition particle receptor subunit beta